LKYKFRGHLAKENVEVESYLPLLPLERRIPLYENREEVVEPLSFWSRIKASVVSERTNFWSGLKAKLSG
jgi:hypothetical protein